LKATNFIMAKPVPVLIDLDSMREYTHAADFRKVKDRDMERFLLNWQADSKLQGSFLKAFQDI